MVAEWREGRRFISPVETQYFASLNEFFHISPVETQHFASLNKFFHILPRRDAIFCVS
jgi:hypothetical protein